jgi:hypothetical protein
MQSLYGDLTEIAEKIYSDLYAEIEKESPEPDPGVFDPFDLTALIFPGVLKIECIPEKRAYFVESDDTLCDGGKIHEELESGVYPNKKLVDDYKKYVFKNCPMSVVNVGKE